MSNTMDTSNARYWVAGLTSKERLVLHMREVHHWPWKGLNAASKAELSREHGKTGCLWRVGYRTPDRRSRHHA